jgi:hypothetical protein
MKKLILSMMACTILLSAQAQSEKLKEALGNALEHYKSAESADEKAEANNQIARIAEAEPKEWLPLYYLALNEVTSTYQGQDLKNVDGILDKAEEHLNKAEALMPNNSEIYTVRAMLNGSRVMVDPMTRWQKYGAAASKATEIAKKLDPKNPRIILYEAQSIFYRPANFGGGKKPALPIAEKASAMFKEFKPENELMPNWGKDIAEQLVLQCKEQ